MFAILGLPAHMPILAGTKLLLFTACIIILTVHSGLDIDEHDIGGALGTAMTGAFGFATAGLLLTTLLTYIAGFPLLDPLLPGSPSLVPLLAQSRLVGIVIEYQHLWYTLPAILLITNGFLARRQ